MTDRRRGRRLAVQTIGGGEAPGLQTTGPFQPPPTGSVPRLATGGRVEGPAGLDTVPTLLTRGEFVLREPAARKFPSGLLDQLNAVGPAALPSSPSLVEPSASSVSTSSPVASPDPQPVQLLGDITVQVTQPSEIDDVLQQLELGRMRHATRVGL